MSQMPKTFLSICMLTGSFSVWRTLHPSRISPSGTFLGTFTDVLERIPSKGIQLDRFRWFLEVITLKEQITTMVSDLLPVAGSLSVTQSVYVQGGFVPALSAFKNSSTETTVINYSKSYFSVKWKLQLRIFRRGRERTALEKKVSLPVLKG